MIFTLDSIFLCFYVMSGNKMYNDFFLPDVGDNLTFQHVRIVSPKKFKLRIDKYIYLLFFRRRWRRSHKPTRQFSIELQKEYCMKTKVIALN